MREMIQVENLISARNLTKSFKDNKVLRGISFDVRRGEVLCMLGPNGAGKSTTINILTTALSSDGGEIFYKGARIGRHLRAYKQSLGIVPQDISLYEELSGERNLRFLLHCTDCTARRSTAPSTRPSGLQGLKTAGTTK